MLTNKIVFGLTNMNPEDFFSHSLTVSITPGAMHTNSCLACTAISVDVRKGFFTERVVKACNRLLAELLYFSSLSVFKSFVFSTDLSDFVMC